MLKFVLNIITVLAVSCAIILLIALKSINFDCIDFKADADRHILVVGQSTTELAVNDSIYTEAINYSHGGYEMNILNCILDQMIKQNPQVDTVLIYAGRLTLYYSQGDLQHMTLPEIKFRIPIVTSGINNGSLSSATLKELSPNPYFYSALLSPEFNLALIKKQRPTDGGFKFSKRGDTILFSDVADDIWGKGVWGINWYDKYAVMRKDNILQANNKQRYLDGINHAVDICRKNGVEPVLFMTPLYQYDRWCPWSECIDALSELDGSLYVADYEDFKFPDYTYYADVHHLNQKGAEYFSNALKRDGIHYVKLSDWLLRK